MAVHIKVLLRLNTGYKDFIKGNKCCRSVNGKKIYRNRRLYLITGLSNHTIINALIIGQSILFLRSNVLAETR
jgi:hypothetical protein